MSSRPLLAIDALGYNTLPYITSLKKQAPAAAPAEETVDVVDAAPAAGSDGTGAADTATEEVMDTGHSSDEDSLPPTPVEAAAPVTNNEGEQAGGEGADGGEADGEATVENDAAEAEAGAEVEMEAEEATSPSDATDPQVYSHIYYFICIWIYFLRIIFFPLSRLFWFIEWLHQARC